MTRQASCIGFGIAVDDKKIAGHSRRLVKKWWSCFTSCDMSRPGRRKRTAYRQAWGRPVDVQVMPDGALQVSDDQSGAIYRITYAK